MKKFSKKTVSNTLNALLIVGTIVLVIALGARNGDISDAWTALLTADRRWILLSFAASICFILFETLVLHTFYRMQHVKVRFTTSLLTTLIGIFYSNVTPAATGGQPMQLLAMSKRKVPAGVTTSALTVKFFCFQVVLLLLGGASCLLFPDVIQTHIGGERWFIYIGFALNVLAVGAVLLLAINPKWVLKLCSSVLHLGCRLRLIRKPEAARSRMNQVLSDFHASVDMVTRHPLQLLELLLLSCMQVLGLMSVTYCVYRAVGLNDMPYLHILALQLLLFIGASFVPSPGSSGAQEGGFYLIFRLAFPGSKLLGALLLWRFFTYYLTLLLGLGAVICDSVRTMRGSIRPMPVSTPKEADLS